MKRPSRATRNILYGAWRCIKSSFSPPITVSHGWSKHLCSSSTTMSMPFYTFTTIFHIYMWHFCIYIMLMILDVSVTRVRSPSHGRSTKSTTLRSSSPTMSMPFFTFLILFHHLYIYMTLLQCVCIIAISAFTLYLAHSNAWPCWSMG